MKEFLIFRNDQKEEGSKKPDFRLMAKINNTFVEIGGGWIRKSKKGTSMISCLLSKPYKERKGWHLIEDDNDTEALYNQA